MKKVLVFLIAALALSCAFPGMAAPVTRQEEIDLEGTVETVTVTRYESALGYTIWYDATLFQVTTEGGVDTFKPIDEKAVSPVYMTIKRVTEGTPESIVEQALAGMQGGEGEKYDASYEFGGYDAYAMYYMDDQVMTDVMVISSGTNTFRVDMVCALEASEGYGNRMWYSLMNFEPA